LHPPAPSDDFPDFAEQWLWYEIEIAHHFLCIECDYGEFQRCMEPLSPECGSGSFCLNPSFPPNAQSLICADDQQCTLQSLNRDSHQEEPLQT
jgi:hypothetical protein